ncbi:MAG: DUF2279 domain-containing protein [Bacteroidia bacterium]
MKCVKHQLNNLFRSAFLILVLLASCPLKAQRDSTSILKTRKIVLLSGTTLVTGGSLIALNQAWYKQYSSGKFHFFNDDAEWLQMDKCGHSYTTFQTSGLMIKTFRWAGFNKRQQLFIGGTLGLGYMTAIEMMDGFSSGWGFSWGDMLANTLGTTFSIGQYALWNEHRIIIKFSYHPETIAKYNPDLLGASPAEQLLKNYNGQTYWLSVSPFSFYKGDRKLPKWLALSFGYGADGMLGAVYNNIVVTDDQGNVKTFDRSRQFYMSFDIDFSKIKTNSKVLKTLFNAVNLLKIPAPTIEFMNGKAKFHYIYF